MKFNQINVYRTFPALVRQYDFVADRFEFQTATQSIPRPGDSRRTKRVMHVCTVPVTTAQPRRSHVILLYVRNILCTRQRRRLNGATVCAPAVKRVTTARASAFQNVVVVVVVADRLFVLVEYFIGSTSCVCKCSRNGFSRPLNGRRLFKIISPVHTHILIYIYIFIRLTAKVSRPIPGRPPPPLPT